MDDTMKGDFTTDEIKYIVDELEEIQNQTGCMLTIDTGHANTCGNLKRS